MKHIDASDDLVNDFQPSELPAVGPDGAPEIPPLRPDDEPPPRLCEAGPCVHYHRFGIQLDAARPIAARVAEGGKLEGEAPPMPFYTRIHHYCYPTIGVETKLGDLPVLECNRWKPVSGAERAHATADREEFSNSEHGKDFWARLEKWKEARMKEATDRPAEGGELDEAALFISMHMVDDAILKMYQSGTNEDGEPVLSLHAETARAEFDRTYLQNSFGAGIWVACIDRTYTDDQTQETKTVRIARHIFEVT